MSGYRAAPVVVFGPRRRQGALGGDVDDEAVQPGEQRLARLPATIRSWRVRERR
ncbi:hypothetical protein ACSNOI_45295 [Actinomadura kijaniata]|uniref:hypothetical protein n=1 Tax=Actinomadura kijaniata TaxID=46161 RepID=UPI003F1C04AB